MRRQRRPRLIFRESFSYCLYLQLVSYVLAHQTFDALESVQCTCNERRRSFTSRR